MPNRLISVITILVAALLSVVLVGRSAAAPQAELWPHWLTHDGQSEQQVDHSAWAEFLDRHLVSGVAGAANLVRYRQAADDDRQLLDTYLGKLAATPVGELDRAEQKAYWINLYNALTVRTIVENYPVDSIRDIKSGWFSAGPWDLKLISVDGQELSLNDIEHRILRPIWQDNRIHYAVNCASIGCPNLQPQPYTAGNSEQLLDQAAHDYVNSPRGVRFEENKLIVSSIYTWYRDDFAADDAGLLSYLAEWADPETAARLRDYRGPISDDYDWRLNDMQ
jgi:hypothetical protein